MVTLFPESSLTKSMLPTISFVAGDDPFLFNFIVDPFASAFVLKIVTTGFAEVELSMLRSEPVMTRSSSPFSSYSIVQSSFVPNFNSLSSGMIVCPLALAVKALDASEVPKVVTSV